MHINKVHHVTTIARVAKDAPRFNRELASLVRAANAPDVANEMDVEDGLIWVHGVGEDGVMAFTDFGIENLTERFVLISAIMR